MADENKVGRPLKFKSVEELQRKVNEYFESCFEEEWEYIKTGDSFEWVLRLDRHGEPLKRQVEPFTITGLAVFLETTRRTLLDYEARNDEFSHTITHAKARIEHYAERQLFNTEARNGSSIQFNLKNNHGWTDKQELEHSGDLNFVVNRKRIKSNGDSDD